MGAHFDRSAKLTTILLQYGSKQVLLRVSEKFGNTGCLVKVAVLKMLFEIIFIFFNSHLFAFPPLRLSIKINTFTTRESPRTVKGTVRHFERAVSLTDCVGESEGGRTVPIKLSSLEVSDGQLG